MRLCFIYLEFPLSLKKENIYIFYIAVYKSRLYMYSINTRGGHMGTTSMSWWQLNHAGSSIFSFWLSNQEIQAEGTFTSISMMSSTQAISPLSTEARIRQASKQDKVLFD